MSDLFDQVTADQDPFKKLASKIPGFSGYIERQNRRAADKLLRETIADRFEELYARISSLQTDLISQGEILYVDDLEKAALKVRTFTDKIRRATYGYSGFFDATKVNEDELARVYQYDLTMLEMVDTVARAIDNVEASMGTDGLPAAIRHLVSQAQTCLDTFNRRDEVMKQGA
ncbi:MAG: hypothetical protein JW862_19625 [Anaerolineales bacterium]|nr:hypothetical protein [Anaerolineales bacterium]